VLGFTISTMLVTVEELVKTIMSKGARHNEFEPLSSAPGVVS
jgi:hypothetical protein